MHVRMVLTILRVRTPDWKERMWNDNKRRGVSKNGEKKNIFFVQIEGTDGREYDRKNKYSHVYLLEKKKKNKIINRRYKIIRWFCFFLIPFFLTPWNPRWSKLWPNVRDGGVVQRPDELWFFFFFPFGVEQHCKNRLMGIKSKNEWWMDS